MDVSVLVEEALIVLGNYGFIIVILFGILHPIIDNPWSFLTMSLSFTLLGIPFGFLLLLISNIIGILLLYLITKKIDNTSNHYLYDKKVSGSVLKWLESTPLWKHVLVIGVPLVPTFFLKIAFPFTTLSFKKYFITVLLSYLFLYSIYSMVYFGVLTFLTDNIPNYIGVILVSLFIAILYFGKDVYKRLLGGIQHEH